MIKKRLILFLLAIVMSVSYASQTPQKLTVILDWFPNPDHAPLVIAQQQGFFKEQGLEVELIGPADPNDPPKWVAAGKADIAITYQPQFMQQVDQGLPLIRIGTLIDKPLNCIVALKENGIQTLGDLKNKRIGSSSGGGLSNALLKLMLTKQGLTDKDVEVVNVRYNLTQALLSRKVDAVTGMNRNFEVPQLELAGKEIVTFFPEEHGVPNYDELIFVINTAKIHDERLPKFLAALKKSIAYLDSHPHQTWQQFAKKYPEANNKLNHETWLSTIPYFAEDPASFRKSHWESFALFMHQNGLIKKIQPVSRYAVVLPSILVSAPEM